LVVVVYDWTIGGIQLTTRALGFTAVGGDFPVLRKRRVAPRPEFVLLRRSRGNATTRGSPRPKPREETLTPRKNATEGRRFVSGP
jgi:hypothetical protein